MELLFLQLCISLSLFHEIPKNHPQVYLTPGHRKVEHRKVFIPSIKVMIIGALGFRVVMARKLDHLPK